MKTKENTKTLKKTDDAIDSPTSNKKDVNQETTLQSTSVTTLKALAFDITQQIQMLQEKYRVVLTELQKREDK